PLPDGIAVDDPPVPVKIGGRGHEHLDPHGAAQGDELPEGASLGPAGSGHGPPHPVGGQYGHAYGLHGVISPPRRRRPRSRPGSEPSAGASGPKAGWPGGCPSRASSAGKAWSSPR